jgi:hypothetical protein
MTEIDNNIVIPCPLKGFALRRARHCFECEHYQGLAQATQGGAPIEDMYMVICAKPITRRLQRIEAD